MVRLCFVCLGNICRSPTAEAVMRRLLADRGLHDLVEVDSAGTGDWHVGQPADRRAREAARSRGFELVGRARTVSLRDFERFDYMLAMDRSNAAALEASAPPNARATVRMLREFEPGGSPDLEVPDPYYGDADGFAEVLDICERACLGLIAHLKQAHGL